VGKIRSWLGGTRRLVFDVGRHGLLLGPVRRAFVEPAASVSNEVRGLLLSYYGERLSHAGLIAGSSGNLSVRLSDSNTIYITPHASSKAFLRRSDLTRVSLDDDDFDRERVSMEYPMHHACYEADEGVGAVIHTHAPALTAVGILGLDVAEVLPEIKGSFGTIQCIPYTEAGSRALADAVGDAVREGAKLVILERHGAVSVGADLSEACDRMELGELSARTVLWAGGRADVG
jgi:L-fuculose-phosphate aldolase